MRAATIYISGSPGARPGAVLFSVLGGVLFSVGTAHAGATVDVEVTVGDGFPAPATPNLGYIAPALPNAVRTVAPYDPIPECFVYLEGEAPQKPDAPLTVPWSLRSHSFDALVLPVVAGSTIVLTNNGRDSHFLKVDNVPDLAGAIAPTARKDTRLEKENLVVHVTSGELPHLEAWIVTLPGRTFARANAKGVFSIPDVPAGTYTIKVWFRDRWIVTDGGKVDVPTKPGKVTAKVALSGKAP